MLCLRLSVFAFLISSATGICADLPERKIDSLNQAADAYSKTGDSENEINCLLKALNLAEEQKLNKQLGNVLGSISTFYREKMRNYGKALDFSLREISLYENTGEQFKLAQAYANTGDIYYDMASGNTQKALDHYRKAEAIFVSLQYD